MRRVVIVIIGLGLIVSAGCQKNQIKAEDEGPIIVKNGSMTIDTDAQSKWQDDSGQWSNESGRTHRGEFFVRVDLNDGTNCRGSGHPVRIETSVSSFTANFNIVGNPARTKVTPKNDFARDSDQRLRHGNTGDGTYITGVKIGGNQLSCNITKENLVAVNICSSRDITTCQ